MQYRLRTLLIVLAIGPPILAGLSLYHPVLQATLLAFTIRDALWLTLVLGLSLAWWFKHRRSERRVEALANRVHQIRS